MPPEGVARCRAAWARLIGHQTCVVHGNLNNLGDVRMTSNRVALIDWDESYVDVPTSTGCCPTTPLVSTTARMTSPRKRRPRGKPPSAGTRVRNQAACRSSNGLSSGSESKDRISVIACVVRHSKAGLRRKMSVIRVAPNALDGKCLPKPDARPSGWTGYGSSILPEPPRRHDHGRSSVDSGGGRRTLRNLRPPYVDVRKCIVVSDARRSRVTTAGVIRWPPSGDCRDVP